MRTFILSLALAMFAVGQAEATCFGSQTFSTCNDASGNSYTVQRFGNQTTVNGFNAQTGSNWSENSMTLGNSTYIHGMANGQPWNETETNFGGGMRSIYGTDSDGNPYSYNCNRYTGCN